MADQDCPTICDPDCPESCHEAHQPGWLREHAPAFHGAPDVAHEPPISWAACTEKVIVLDEPPMFRPCGRVLTNGHCGVHS